MRISFFAVRNYAMGAVLYTIFGIGEIPTAPLTHRIKRTVAKKAVKTASVVLMAREIFTIFIFKKRIIVFIPIKKKNNSSVGLRNITCYKSHKRQKRMKREEIRK